MADTYSKLKRTALSYALYANYLTNFVCLQATNNKTANVASDKTADLDKQIVQQGDLVRELKAKKAVKDQIDVAVKQLLSLKADYKAASGKDWKPGQTPAAMAPTSAAPAAAGDAASVNASIVKQGDLVRELKGKKAAKPEIDAAVKQLLELKAQYKTLTGQDWKPGTVVAAATPAPAAAAAAASAPASSDISAVLDQIAAQGDKVRELKAAKADKATIDAAVKTLLSLKADYKQLSGSDWKPGTTAPAPAAIKVKQEKSPEPAAASAVANLLNKITQQGDKIRQLKSAKAEKSLVDAEVKLLLALKTDYKSLTGQEWKPGTVAPIAAPVATVDLTAEDSSTGGDFASILSKIKEQGDRIRQLKAAKAAKGSIDPEVQKLLTLKAEYKTLSGKDWTPDVKVEVKGEIKAEVATSASDQLTLDINAQGEKVRAAKSSNAAKEIIDEEVRKLLELKAKYKEVTGTDFPVAGRAGGGGSAKKAAKEPQQKAAKPAKKPAPAAPKPDSSSGVKKQTRLGLEATKEDNLPDWYSQVITKGELIEYYDVSGCYILRHWSFAIWKAIKNWFDAEITSRGVKECYFPIFVSKAALEREKDHIADFAPEVAWVTKSGDSDLAEPIAVRPTSETVMYPAYAKWIQSYRDLPIRLNQWNNVVVSSWKFNWIP